MVACLYAAVASDHDWNFSCVSGASETPINSILNYKMAPLACFFFPKFHSEITIMIILTTGHLGNNFGLMLKLLASFISYFYHFSVRSDSESPNPTWLGLFLKRKQKQEFIFAITYFYQFVLFSVEIISKQSIADFTRKHLSFR